MYSTEGIDLSLSSLEIVKARFSEVGIWNAKLEAYIKKKMDNKRYGLATSIGVDAKTADNILLFPSKDMQKLNVFFSDTLMLPSRLDVFVLESLITVKTGTPKDDLLLEPEEAFPGWDKDVAKTMLAALQNGIKSASSRREAQPVTKEMTIAMMRAVAVDICSIIPNEEAWEMGKTHFITIIKTTPSVVSLETMRKLIDHDRATDRPTRKEGTDD